MQKTTVKIIKLIKMKKSLVIIPIKEVNIDTPVISKNEFIT